VRDFLTLDDISVDDKIVLLRADLNVPMQGGVVTDASRIERLLPTVKELTAAGARLVILSHFGRPDGKVDPKYSLRPLVADLERRLKQRIAFAEDCVGPKAEAAIAALQPGHVLLLENTRFHPEEEANDPAFAKALAHLGDIYVNDAFSAAHRAHASTEGIAHHLPSAAGRLMQTEIDALNRALSHPEKPVAAIVGGSKISSKLDLLHNLVTKVDILVLGGGMANTFLAAKGVAIGTSLCEPNMYLNAKQIMAEAEKHNCHIALPKDVVIAPALKEGEPTQTVLISAVPEDQMILDIGPASVKTIKQDLALCKTVVWNGPLGAFEIPPFDAGTTEVAICVADLTKRGIILSVAGGGDTVSALANAGVTHGVSYLSTAGGAFLEWLEGKTLPGVLALMQASPKRVGKVII